jgi:hypothetical protein
MLSALNDLADRRLRVLGGCEDTVRFVFDPPRESLDVGMRSESVERVAFAFQFLDIDGSMDVPVARATKQRDTVVNVLPGERLFVALVLVPGSRNEMMTR